MIFVGIILLWMLLIVASNSEVHFHMQKSHLS